jgi:hypothetical protein
MIFINRSYVDLVCVVLDPGQQGFWFLRMLAVFQVFCPEQLLVHSVLKLGPSYIDLLKMNLHLCACIHSKVGDFLFGMVIPVNRKDDFL